MLGVKPQNHTVKLPSHTQITVTNYRVQQNKVAPKVFFAVFSATIWNFNLKFFRLIYWNVLHLTAK